MIAVQNSSLLRDLCELWETIWHQPGDDPRGKLKFPQIYNTHFLQMI